MSGYKFHFVFGLLISLLVLIILDSFNFLGFNPYTFNFLSSWFLVSLIFSLVPDIDSKNSKVSYYLHVFVFICTFLVFFKLVNLFEGISIIFVLILLEIYHFLFAKKGRKHRHWSHKIWFGSVLAIFIFLITNSWSLAILGLLSFLSHLFVDFVLPY